MLGYKGDSLLWADSDNGEHFCFARRESGFDSNIDLGTNSDNMMDIPEEFRVSKASNASKKYSDELVQAIRHDKERGMSYKELMIKYNISSKGTLSYIINHRQ